MILATGSGGGVKRGGGDWSYDCRKFSGWHWAVPLGASKDTLTPHPLPRPSHDKPRNQDISGPCLMSPGWGGVQNCPWLRITSLVLYLITLYRLFLVTALLSQRVHSLGVTAARQKSILSVLQMHVIPELCQCSFL